MQELNIEEILKEQFHLLDTKIQTTQDTFRIISDNLQNQINQLIKKVDSYERKLLEVRDRK